MDRPRHESIDDAPNYYVRNPERTGKVPHQEPNDIRREQPYLHLQMSSNHQPNFRWNPNTSSWNHQSSRQAAHNNPPLQLWPSASATSVSSTHFATQPEPILPSIVSVETQPTEKTGIPPPQPTQQHEGPAILQSSTLHTPVTASSTILPKPRRPRQSATSLADWGKYRADIKKLYIDENLPLARVQEVMKDKFGFISSDKLYKEKLDDWGYVKNLPVQTAVWVLEKHKRRRDEGKDTVYEFGRKPLKLLDVEKKAKRANIQRNEPSIINSQTPRHLTYFTPKRDEGAISPQTSIIPPPNTATAAASSVESNWSPPPKSHESMPEVPRLSWEGHSRAELATLQEDAQNLARLEQIEEAEDKYRQVLMGLEYLLSSTHEATSTVAYELADLYAKNQRMHDADAVIDWLGREHIECWGVRNQKTVAHVLRAMQLYHNWSRPDEAVSLLNRTFRTSQTLPYYADENSPKTSQRLNKARGSDSRDMSSREGVNELSRFVHQLATAKQHLKGAEPLLLSLISQCRTDQQVIPVSQQFDAECTLAQLYQTGSDLYKLYPALKNAEDTFHKALMNRPKHLGVVLKMSINLVNMLYKAELGQQAESMLQKIEKTTIDVLEEEGADHVDILVALGKFYQEHNKWNKAELHFEHALTISMRIHQLDCRVVRVLEAAIENGVFDPSKMDTDSMKLHFRQQGFARCGCGGFMGEFGTRF